MKSCPKCGMVRREAGPGSITQWISTCQCDELKLDSTDDAGKEQIMLCSVCQKRISTGRVGSLTQWVFRSDLCACQKPSPIAAPQAVTADVSKDTGHNFSKKDRAGFEEADDAILVDAENFPMDRYRALSEIGRGVSGIVYRSIDRMLKKQVAIKCLRSVTANELMSFQKEAQATSRLNHPNIVKIFDFGASPGGAPYMVMEFVPGISLKQLIDEVGPLQEHEALPFFLDLANALAHAHSKGIFHRDLKSSNIIISDNHEQSDKQNVRLIDFGVASLKGLESPFQKDTVLVGTPLYMAPDQVAGKPFDARSEVYSLGCVLYEMLTGNPPFIGETALETLNMHANRIVVPLFQARPDCQFSEEVDGLVLRCLAKQPEQRFQSMQELAAEIESIIARAAGDPAKDVSAIDSSAASETHAAGLIKSKSTVAFLLIATLCLAVGVLIFNRLAPFSGHEEPKIKYLQSKHQLPKTVSEWVPPDENEVFKIEPDHVTIIAGDDKSLEKLANRPGVTQLELSKCRITEKGVEKLLPLKLKSLHIHKTTFDTTGLTALGKLGTLKVLRIANCKWFTGTDFKIFVNTPLRELTIADSDLLDSSLIFLKNQSSLETLAIVNNPQFTGSGLGYLAGCKKLKELRVSEMPNLSDKCFAHIAKLPSLRSLTLVATAYQPGRSEDDLAAALGGPKEKPYDLESFEQITSIKSLDTLSLDCNRLEKRHFDSLSKMNGLIKLTLVGREWTSPQCVAQLAKLRSLYTLEVLGPCLDRAGIKQVSTLKNVKRLALLNCELSDSSLADFPKSNVSELIIDGDNLISGVGLDYLAQMRRLKLLRLPKVWHVTTQDLKRFKFKKPQCRIE